VVVVVSVTLVFQTYQVGAMVTLISTSLIMQIVGSEKY